MYLSGNRNNLAIRPIKGFPVRVQTSTRRRKTITIKVLDTEIVVQAPHTSSIEHIEQALKKHNKWILSVLAERQALQDNSKSSHEDTWRQSLLYQGIPLVLRYQPTDSLKTIHIDYNQPTLEVYAPPQTDPELKTIIVTWFKTKAKEYIPVRVQHWANILGASYGDVRIKDVSSRWGSCSTKGNLNFNWRLICTPAQVLDYVIIHELSHLWEMNHSKRFWDRVERAMPAYKEAQMWLRAHGKSLYF